MGGPERSEPERSGGAPTLGGATPTSQNPVLPDPEVVARPARRRFTADYKLRILREADRCTRLGEVGPTIRRAGWLGGETN